jgi:hypothetical protein
MSWKLSPPGGVAAAWIGQNGCLSSAPRSMNSAMARPCQSPKGRFDLGRLVRIAGADQGFEGKAGACQRGDDHLRRLRQPGGKCGIAGAVRRHGGLADRHVIGAVEIGQRLLGDQSVADKP